MLDNKNVKVYSVTELTREIKSVLEEEFQSIWLEGEISNYLHHTSGHHYFTLKDKTAQIKAVIWRFQAKAMNVKLQNGMQVKIFGDITLYEKSGVYQIRVNRIQIAGVGTLEQQFQKLKEKLDSEGLFDAESKMAIPEFPEAIGIVTSPTGAAIRDIINICKRRAPGVKLILRPAKVQGDGAAEDIATAIAEFNRYQKIDLMIIGRGGGSLEDLWAFNEEIVARAIYDSEIPIISAVGHEIDFTIADFTADLRASTPSAAAEIATYDRKALLNGIAQRQLRLTRSLKSMTEIYQHRLSQAVKSRVFRKPDLLLEASSQRYDDLQTRLLRSLADIRTGNSNKLTLLTEKLKSLSPDSVLKRGFSIVRKLPEREIVIDAAKLKSTDKVLITFSKGEKTAVIEKDNLNICRRFLEF